MTFDPDFLRDKYRLERAKRLRSEGSAQYVATEGARARFLDDPHADANFIRAPFAKDVDVAMIGGGFGGLLTAVRLREAGVANVLIIDKASDFGGTWYWNRYPGAACDIESYIYMPLLEELGVVPSEKYARGPEILAHAQAIGRRYGLYEAACFQTEVTELRWDADIDRWIVSTNRADKIRARFVCMSTGPLHRPKLPGIAGIDSFKGHSFHTSRWDYEYTGGDSTGGLTGLTDKRVGIVGTGATAVQVIPHLAAAARHLDVFQRTPSAINRRDNRPTDPNWAETRRPGWQQARMDNFHVLVSGGAAEVDLVDDGWTHLIGRGIELSVEEAEQRQLADFRKMEQVRARVDAIVRDGKTAEALKPFYNQMCKRPCFHDEYLQCFNLPNVRLVDTNGRGVEQMTERGVVVAGHEFELDCLIYSTGFEFETALAHRTGYEIFGRNGRSLSAKWQDGISSLFGIHIRGFPNCMILANAQQAVTPNFTHLLNEGAHHVAYVVSHAFENNITAVEPSAKAEQDWVDHVMSFAEARRRYDQDCTPGYYNNEGMPSAQTVRNGYYGGGSIRFFQMLRNWRAQGELAGLERSRAQVEIPG